MKCCVCNREWPDPKCHTVTLTDDEKAYIRNNGGTVPDTYHYCGPCWKVLSDPLMGAQLIRGTIQSHLMANKVPNAEVLSQLFFKRLMGLKGSKR